MLRRLTPIMLALAVVAAPTVAQEPDLAQLVADLELPSIGALTFGVGIHIGMLDDKLTDEEIETQIKALEADAT
ncbi:MAG TPA: hypothetical protein QGH10_23470, partial [Armatimonadota bacterium]|nr:hypothetical protein [Armatimonadota bacterium]